MHCALTKEMRWASNIFWYIAKQLKDSWAQVWARSFLWFIDAVPKIRKLSCSFQEKANYFLKFLSNLDINTIEVYMARKHAPVISKERLKPEQQLLFWNLNCRSARMLALLVPEFKLTGNLNLFDFIPQVLRCQGIDRGKSKYFKASDLFLVNTTQGTHWVCNLQRAFSSLQI
jgi:hypothetical protein